MQYVGGMATKAVANPWRRTLALPDSICFRVTRNCNARCAFCLAPPDGDQPSATVLKQRIDWLLSHGVNTIHFCGGEPTVHPGLGELLTYTVERGGRSEMTSNGIACPAALFPILKATRTRVRISLHGDQVQHNAMVGVTAFKHTTRTIQRLLAEDVNTSIQTTLVAGKTAVIDWIAQYCLAVGVRRLNLLPFIPRGNGIHHRDEFALTSLQRRELRTVVQRTRHLLNGRVDVRWLDFNTKVIHVVEPDGRIILEGATETMDRLLYRIPETILPALPPCPELDVGPV